MFFPLGLGFKIKNFPLVTWLIIFACAFVYFFGQQKDDYQRAYMSLPEHREVIIAQDYLFYEYCREELGNPLCERFAFERGLVPQFQYDLDLLGLDFNLSREALEQFASLYRDFARKLKARGPQIEKLPSFPDYTSAVSSLEKQTQRLREFYNLLHHDNITLYTLFLAVFSHETLMHLLGNMLFLFIFGRYVEQRVGPVPFLVSYIVLGTMALGLYAWFNDGNFLHILGASANVSVVMGAFYALFFHKKLKVFFFYLGVKIARFPVKTYMFLFFMLQEFIYSFTALESVAYGAHAAGLVLGMSFGVAWKRIRPVPSPFIYEYEHKEWQSLQFKKDRAIFIEKALNLVKYNPDNNVIVRELVRRLAPIELELSEMDLDEEILLRQLIPTYLKDLYKNDEFNEFYESIERLPHSWSMSVCLSKFSQKDLLKLIDKCIDDERLLTSVLVIQAFVERYEKSPKVKNLLKTLGSVLDHIPLNSFYRRHLLQIKSLSTSTGLKNAINKRFLRQAYD
ncbi:MAG: hypothetical protein CME64_11525 [Halobacteriovoraceae bacterium]|nr:hypothetical protein [Halobacteriovoraceae bacterium]